MADLFPEPAAAKSLAHPVRAEILRRLYDRERSPVKLARETGQTLSSVAYHVRELEKLGAIVLTRRQEVRGVVEHLYTATVRITLTQESL